MIQADRRQEAEVELDAIARALESYYHENAAFPASLTAAGFLGDHLQRGVADTAIQDPFGGNQNYVYSVDTVANTATAYSRGEDGLDNGVGLEEQVVVVAGAVPGTNKTFARVRLIVEVLANHIEVGGSVTGTWPTVRAAIGLGSSYDTDGFGVTFDWDDSTHTLTSAGPDRTLGNADDIVF
ncbi:MAG: type IV pilin-like G/H family protein [bacterium]|nr:type IV pilin-like G/H family protein [bacterium]